MEAMVVVVVCALSCSGWPSVSLRFSRERKPRNTKTRMVRHGSCSAWDEDDMMADDMMAEALTRSASAAQREARELHPSQISRKHSPQPPAPKRACTVGVCGR